ncbi:MAG: hypothetical protein RBT33_03490 [Candidatus Dojkabacteria bacterium]|jgi:hypothetical protein|nr:hypothetical protein [Candidatus Dojkabacteria bacterium]
MAEIKELQPKSSFSVEGLQPSLEVTPAEIETTAAHFTQEVEPTIKIESADTNTTTPHVQSSSTRVDTFKRSTFNVSAPTKDGSTWVEILEAKKIGEELPQ